MDEEIGMKRNRLLPLLFFLAWPPAAACQSESEFASQRAALVKEIAAEAAETAGYTGREHFNPRVMEVMGSVPRHLFVPEPVRPAAYVNRPLPIGNGQTISQPYIVALMTDLLEPKPEHKVLEVGTGSGYQAAVLAKLVRHVYSIEIVKPLGEQAAKLLRTQGYDNVTVRIGDGYHGWPEHAPFDSIIVTAAAESIPPALVKQIKPGGRMVIPVGEQFSLQTLKIVEKDAKGAVTTRGALPVRFVPLTGDH
jgi:protein-L-isoaspartate(D-aspartate) O-methyltransferase